MNRALSITRCPFTGKWSTPIDNWYGSVKLAVTLIVTEPYRLIIASRTWCLVTEVR